MALKLYVKYVQCFRSYVTGHTPGWLELPNPTRFRWTGESRPAKGAIKRNLPTATLADSLRDLGLKAIEAIDYIDESNQHASVKHILTCSHFFYFLAL